MQLRCYPGHEALQIRSSYDPFVPFWHRHKHIIKVDSTEELVPERQFIWKKERYSEGEKEESSGVV